MKRRKSSQGWESAGSPLYCAMRCVRDVALSMAAGIAFAACSQVADLRLTLGESDPVVACRVHVEQGEARQDGHPNPDACERALAKRGDGAAKVMLGQMYLRIDRPDLALARFKEAAESGYCEAHHFVGDLIWRHDGNKEGAEAAYRRGAECGDELAAHELFDPEVFASSAYPEYVRAMATGDIDPLQEVRPVAASWVRGFYEGLSEHHLGADFDPCYSATYFGGGEHLLSLRKAENGDARNVLEALANETALPLYFRVTSPGLGTDAVQEVRKALHAAGTADARRVVSEYACGTLLITTMLHSVERFVAAPRPLVDVVSNYAKR